MFYTNIAKITIAPIVMLALNACGADLAPTDSSATAPTTQRDSRETLTIQSPDDGKRLTRVNGATTACISLFLAGLQIGIRNNCPQCKMAVMSWLNGTTGATTISRYRVTGNNQIIIPAEGISSQLIGEDPC